jgi:hypothetical protein
MKWTFLIEFALATIIFSAAACPTCDFTPDNSLKTPIKAAIQSLEKPVFYGENETTNWFEKTNLTTNNSLLPTIYDFVPNMTESGGIAWLPYN